MNNVWSLLPIAAAMLNPAKATPVRIISPGNFNFRVALQPYNEPLNVSTKAETVTLFGAPLQNDVTAFLAHNYLAGEEFYELPIGGRIFVEYDDGTFQEYKIEEIRKFQDLGRLMNLRDVVTGVDYSDFEIYEMFYNGLPGSLVLQTCLEENRDSTWGLTFWIAYPVGHSMPMRADFKVYAPALLNWFISIDEMKTTQIIDWRETELKF